VFIKINFKANKTSITQSNHSTKMKYIISLSLLLLGTNAVRDNDEAFRLLRGQGMMGQGGGQGQMMGGGGQGMMGGGGQGMMGGGGRNHTAEDKAEMCAEKGIVCAQVDRDFLANNCTRPEHPSDRDLLMIVEEIHDEFLDGDHRSLRRSGPGGHGGQGGGRFGNMTDADREEMMLKRLTCKCCMEDDGDQN
jgi:hypothetical protein